MDLSKSNTSYIPSPSANLFIPGTRVIMCLSCIFELRLLRTLQNEGPSAKAHVFIQQTLGTYFEEDMLSCPQEVHTQQRMQKPQLEKQCVLVVC